MAKLAKTYEEALVAHEVVRKELKQMMSDYEALPNGGSERRALMRKMQKKNDRMNILFHHMMSF